jgi:L-threonylcarbamoyladenylate synthase
MTGRLEPQIDEAVRRLREGGLVAFPTETVYGLGADASNAAAVARIFAAKGRPADHPLIVHLASAAAAGEWARDFPPPARDLAAAFWPGPLTLVLPRAAGVLDEVTGGQETVALRVPSHPVAQELLRRFGGGIAAPSANRYGRVSPTLARHVREELGDRVDLVLDGGACEVGLESTIVGVGDGAITLLRPGRITRSELEKIAGPLASAGAAAPRVPGSMRSHYAPATPLELLDAAAIDRRCTTGPDAQRIAVLSRRAAPRGCRALVWQVAAADPAGYGHDLYAALRALDARGASSLLVEEVPAGEEWAAVRDRLARAARRDPPDAP